MNRALRPKPQKPSGINPLLAHLLQVRLVNPPPIPRPEIGDQLAQMYYSYIRQFETPLLGKRGEKSEWGM